MALRKPIRFRHAPASIGFIIWEECPAWVYGGNCRSAVVPLRSSGHSGGTQPLRFAVA